MQLFIENEASVLPGDIAIGEWHRHRTKAENVSRTTGYEFLAGNSPPCRAVGCSFFTRQPDRSSVSQEDKQLLKSGCTLRRLGVSRGLMSSLLCGYNFIGLHFSYQCQDRSVLMSPQISSSYHAMMLLAVVVFLNLL